MTKQERNDIILQALQEELQEKPYAKDKLTEIFEQWVQGLVAQGNQILAGIDNPQIQQGESQEPAAQEPPQEEGTANAMPPPVDQQ